MSDETTADHRVGAWELVMVVLSIVVLAMLLIEVMATLTPETKKVLATADTLICLVFIADFFERLRRAPSKRAFLKWNWIDLAGSIPNIDFLRFGRFVRLFRLLRLLRAARSLKVLVQFVYRHQAKGTVVTVGLISFLVWFFGAVAILHCENQPDCNIKDASDSMWWAFVTITTVGYGDKYPITTEGRIIAALLMTTGVGLFGTLTAFLASVFVAPKDQTDDMEKIQTELRQLRQVVDSWDASLRLMNAREGDGRNGPAVDEQATPSTVRTPSD